MTSTTKKILMFGIPIVLIGGYFIYKRMSGNKPSQTPVKDKDGNVVPTTTATPDNSRPSNEKSYVVTASALNLRKEPNQNSQKVGKLNKGCVVKAIPSSTSGWMDINYNFISTDKCFYDIHLFEQNLYGSSQYLKEVN